jgi:hypothetical protein
MGALSAFASVKEVAPGRAPAAIHYSNRPDLLEQEGWSPNDIGTSRGGGCVVYEKVHGVGDLMEGPMGEGGSTPSRSSRSKGVGG